MTAKPDIIWNEQCLGIRISEQICNYLKKHDAEYQRLQKEILKLIERYPVIETFMESNQSISLTTEEHKAVHRYFQLENGKEMIEEQYHFYMGQAQMISYGAMLGKIKKAIKSKGVYIVADGDVVFAVCLVGVGNLRLLCTVRIHIKISKSSNGFYKAGLIVISFITVEV